MTIKYYNLVILFLLMFLVNLVSASDIDAIHSDQNYATFKECLKKGGNDISLCLDHLVNYIRYEKKFIIEGDANQPHMNRLNNVVSFLKKSTDHFITIVENTNDFNAQRKAANCARILVPLSDKYSSYQKVVDNLEIVEKEIVSDSRLLVLYNKAKSTYPTGIVRHKDLVKIFSTLSDDASKEMALKIFSFENTVINNLIDYLGKSLITVSNDELLDEKNLELLVENYNIAATVPNINSRKIEIDELVSKIISAFTNKIQTILHNQELYANSLMKNSVRPYSIISQTNNINRLFEKYNYLHNNYKAISLDTDLEKSLNDLDLISQLLGIVNSSVNLKTEYICPILNDWDDFMNLHRAIMKYSWLTFANRIYNDATILCEKQNQSRIKNAIQINNKLLEKSNYNDAIMAIEQLTDDSTRLTSNQRNLLSNNLNEIKYKKIEYELELHRVAMVEVRKKWKRPLNLCYEYSEKTYAYIAVLNDKEELVNDMENHIDEIHADCDCTYKHLNEMHPNNSDLIYDAYILEQHQLDKPIGEFNNPISKSIAIFERQLLLHEMKSGELSLIRMFRAKMKCSNYGNDILIR